MLHPIIWMSRNRNVSNRKPHVDVRIHNLNTTSVSRTPLFLFHSSVSCQEVVSPEPCLQTRPVIQSFCSTGVKIPANVSSRAVPGPKHRSVRTCPPALDIPHAVVKRVEWVENSWFGRLNQNVGAGAGGTSSVSCLVPLVVARSNVWQTSRCRSNLKSLVRGCCATWLTGVVATALLSCDD